MAENTIELAMNATRELIGKKCIQEEKIFESYTRTFQRAYPGAAVMRIGPCD